MSVIQKRASPSIIGYTHKFSPGTVISIHEAPNYDSPKGDDAEMLRRTEELRNMRKNTHDLLSQLSKIGIDQYKFRVASQKGVRSDLTKTTVRHPASRTRTTVMESSQAVEASANLFYYLFEDYTAPTSFLSNSSVTLGKLVRKISTYQYLLTTYRLLTTPFIDR